MAVRGDHDRQPRERSTPRQSPSWPWRHLADINQWLATCLSRVGRLSIGFFSGPARWRWLSARVIAGVMKCGRISRSLSGNYEPAAAAAATTKDCADPIVSRFIGSDAAGCTITLLAAFRLDLPLSGLWLGEIRCQANLHRSYNE